MVVYDGVAVRFFESVGFQRINGEVARKLGVGLNRDSIRKLVIERAEELKEEMIGQPKNKFVFIKLDACTHL